MGIQWRTTGRVSKRPNPFTIEILVRVKVAALGTVAALVFSSGAWACAMFAPLAQSVAISPYHSPKMYAETTRPFRTFIEFMSREGDRRDAQSKLCVIANMQAWAEANALLEEPVNFEGQRQRLRWATSLNISAAKVGVTATRDPAITQWLRRLTTLVVADFYKHHKRRKSADNLYVWSGVAAASYLMLMDDHSLRDYAHMALLDAISSIRADGSIYWETTRGNRSTPYHLYYIGAVYWLSEFMTLSGSTTPVYNAEFGKLRAYAAGKICGPTQDAFGPRSMISAEFIKIADPIFWGQLRKCGIMDTSIFSPFFGGDMQKTLDLIKTQQK